MQRELVTQMHRFNQDSKSSEIQMSKRKKKALGNNLKTRRRENLSQIQKIPNYQSKPTLRGKKVLYVLQYGH